MFRFVIQGEVVAKKNSRVTNTKTGRSFPSKRYTEWHNKACFELLRQKTGQYEAFPLSGPLAISFEFYHGDNRRRDSDNGVSSILDTLTDCGILTDDSWQIVRELEVKNFFKKNEPYVIITIINHS